MSSWLQIGQDINSFWRLTPRELALVIEGDNTRRVADFEAQRALNHEMARLVAIAFHKPQKLPDHKPLDRKARPSGSSSQVDDERVRAFFIRLASKG